MQIVKGKKAVARKGSKSAGRKRRELVQKSLENPAKRPAPKMYPKREKAIAAKLRIQNGEIIIESWSSEEDRELTRFARDGIHVEVKKAENSGRQK